MAKTSAVEKNKRRGLLVKRFAAKRSRLKAVVMNQSLPLDERFRATIQLAELPRFVFAIVAKFRAVRAVITARSKCRVSHCASWVRSARCLAS
jgi:hypothetical protein